MIRTETTLAHQEFTSTTKIHYQLTFTIADAIESTTLKLYYITVMNIHEMTVQIDTANRHRSSRYAVNEEKC